MSLLVGKEQRRDRWRQILRKATFGTLVLVATILLAISALERWNHLDPPRDDGAPLFGRAQIRAAREGVRLVLGNSYAEREGPLRVVYLQGTARDIGHARGVLAPNDQEPFGEAIDRHTGLPQGGWGAGKRWAAWHRAWQLRHLARQMPGPRVVEIATMAAYLRGASGEKSDIYQRYAYRHLQFDASPLRCKGALSQSISFAVWGRKGDGRTLVGRSFTLFPSERPGRVELSYVRERGRLLFASVGWPGLTGAVTGVNEAKLMVASAAACTDAGTATDGTPSLFIARELLQGARTLKDALSMIKAMKPASAISLLIVDGKTGSGAVAELSPGRLAVRLGNGRLAMTNHFVDPRFRGDARNDWVRRYTPSGVRLVRLQQLVARNAARLDPALAATILRDRKNIKGQALGLGHLAAIDPVVASHGVVVDLTNMILWVGAGPHLLGAFVPFDLRVPFGDVIDAKIPIQPIEADPLLVATGWPMHRMVVAELDRAKHLARKGLVAQSVEHARRAAEAEPDFPLAQLGYGELLRAAGDRSGAATVFRNYLALEPGMQSAVERVQRYLAEER